MDFFGTFLDGPLAGSSFTFSVDNGGEDGGILFAFLGVGMAIFLVLFAVLSPLVIWPITFNELSEEYGNGPTILMCIAEVVYCFLRYRSNVRHWRSGFLLELLPGTLFNGALMMVTMLGTLFYWNVSMDLGVDFGAFLVEVGNNTSLWIGALFVGLLQAILPSFAISKVSAHTIQKISQRI